MAAMGAAMALGCCRGTIKLLLPEALTQHVALLGLVFWLLFALNTVLTPQENLLPSPLNTAHVRTTVTVALAGPLLAVFCSPGAVTVALVVKGPAAVGRTTMASWLLPPTGRAAMLQLTTDALVAVQPARQNRMLRQVVLGGGVVVQRNQQATQLMTQHATKHTSTLSCSTSLVNCSRRTSPGGPLTYCRPGGRFSVTTTLLAAWLPTLATVMV
jgi:hypothetical protein